MAAPYTLHQISEMYGYSFVTTWRHVNKLKAKKLFKKTTIGSYYSEQELKQLSELLQFSIPSK